MEGSLKQFKWASEAMRWEVDLVRGERFRVETCAVPTCACPFAVHTYQVGTMEVPQKLCKSH